MGSTSEYQAKTLVDLLRRKDRRSFDLLYEKYGPSIYCVIQRCVASDKQRENLFKLSMCEIWENIDRFSPTQPSFLQWAIGITFRVVHHHLQQEVTLDGTHEPRHTAMHFAKEMMSNMRRK